MTDLFDTAEKNGVEIIYRRMEKSRAASVCGERGDYVALDYSLMRAPGDERVCLAHELGHCVTGAYYAMYAPFETRERAEAKALRWAIKKLIPLDELKAAIAGGCDNYYMLADRFDVTEDFAKKTYEYYMEGGAII